MHITCVRSEPERSMGETKVKVAVRIRPLLQKEILHQHDVCVRLVPGHPRQVLLGNDRAFTFDFAFGPTAQQDEVYSSCIKPLVTSLLEGYNVTVFAYGQTGSGKTYTIGVSTPEGGSGIIPRATQEIFLRMAASQGTRFSVRVSYIEVYREELRDLLELDTSSKDMHIREDEKGNTVVVGAQEREVESVEELLTLLEAGNAVRRTGATHMNEHSSRSHALLTIAVTQRRRDAAAARAISSKFHLVDLAGSERMARAGNTDRHFKESVQINSGLLALGNVIRALGDPRRRGQHVPYRDAKLTRLLRDSLGGNAQTLMIACVSPSSRCLQESLSSLMFASRARDVRNRPVVNWDVGRERLGALEQEVRSLREALRDQGGASLTDRSSRLSQDRRDQSRIQTLQDQLAQCRQECLQYHALTQEAAELLFKQQDSALGAAHGHALRLQEWLETLRRVQREGHTHLALSEDEAGEEPHITILQLRRELKKCQDALAADEGVFSQRELQLKQLQEQSDTLLATLQEERNRSRLQSEKLVEQELLIGRLRELVTSRTCTSTQRPFSVPLTSQAQGELRNYGNTDVRKVHSSPPAYSLERVMACFKMRSQLLQAQIEEGDEVLQQLDEEEQGGKEEEDQSRAFRRSLNLTWTRKRSNRPSRMPAERSLQLHWNMPQQTTPPAGDSPCVTVEAGSCDDPCTGPESAEVRALRQSQRVNLQRLKEAELRHSHAQQRIKELGVNICLKKSLIEELVKTGKHAEAVDDHSRISLHDQKGQKSALQREGQALAALYLQTEKRRAEQERSVELMKKERETLQRHLQEEESRRSRIQQDLTCDRQTITELQKRALRESMEGKSDHISSAAQKLEEQQRWLDQEEERVLQQKRALAELEEELKCREEIISRRESLWQERSQLELKKLRSSQVLEQDLLDVSSRLGAVDRELEEKCGQEEVGAVEVTGSLSLREERRQLCRRRDSLDSRLRDGNVLSTEEEHTLFQLEEAIEALDTALEYKSLSIRSRQRTVALNTGSSHRDIMAKLSTLSPPETQALLLMYFNKVVCLREGERRLQLHCDELELQLQEQEGVVRELEAALQRLTLDTDRRLTEQQREHQHNVQLLLQELREGGSEREQEALRVREGKIQKLEKELFFYKSTSRQLKKKLRELAHPETSQAPATRGSDLDVPSVSTVKESTGSISGAKESAGSSLGDVQAHSVNLEETPPSSSQSRWRVGEEALGRRGAQWAESASVRVSHRQVRQISPTGLHTRLTCPSAGSSSFQEDSIEVSHKSE
ncbi:kinesin-like protein KIF27 [Megalops cyprinoides]|uniref:kinesin-like protein KIF27 n=1 Tax=Megalops cyprinoides TaxID=118141 RepID=UPI0018644BFE|nr:kinesin-like protein KIF27 [Megalops cyprinoides]